LAQTIHLGDAMDDWRDPDTWKGLALVVVFVSIALWHASTR